MIRVNQSHETALHAQRTQMEELGFVTTIEPQSELSLPLSARFLVAGSIWLITTNAAEILDAARETFQTVDAAASPVALSFACYVDPEIQENKPWPSPHFRGLDHLVYA